MIVVVTAHDDGYREMAAITMPTVKDYCAKHGYGFIYEPNVEPELADACKIGFFHELYASGRYSGDDVFFWIDTDALIMNSAVRLERYVPDIFEAHVLYGSDPNGLNTGAWFARFTSRADHFLRVAQQASFAMGWSDQPGILQTYLQPVFTPWVRIGPGKGFNSMLYSLYGWDWPHGNEINAYEEGDLVLHLPGIERSQRMELLRHYRGLAQ